MAAATNRDVDVASQLAAQTEQLKTLFNQQQDQGRTLECIRRLLQGDGGNRPGVVVRLDRLEQADKRRRWAIYTLGAATVGAIVDGVRRHLTRGG